jgi:ornithine cyclodeaminase/alanine dehydrogenase-like protein (mu-crystallin family)
VTAAPLFLSEEEIYRRLDYDGCIAAMRDVMAGLSGDGRDQPLRQISQLGSGKMFGVMPGLLPEAAEFGAKLVSVFHDPASPGRSAHRGVVVLFDGDSGAVTCIADASAVTHVRTACASAAATDALARRDADVLAIFGCGAQARSHLRALTRVRKMKGIGIWGRNHEIAKAFAREASTELGLEVRAWKDPAALAAEAHIICTVTSAWEPILKGAWVRPGTHVNAVGSSFAGPREIDSELVVNSRYFVDYRKAALVAAAEFLAAKAEGLVDDYHIAGEIGEVLIGRVEGRCNAEMVTIYKSLGHIAQDLAAVRYALQRAPH